MIYLVALYMFFFIFRPFEYWPILGEYRIERVYMLFLMTAVFFWPGKKYLPHSINRTVLLFFAAMAVSTIWALKFQVAYDATFEFFKLMVFFFILVLTLRDEKDLKLFVMAYLVIMSIYVGKSAWEFFIHDRHFYRMGIRRMIGVDTTYGDPNSFAASIAYSLPFLWAMLRFYWRDNRWIRNFLVGYGVLAAVAVVFTGSRSGMVICLLFLVLAWWESAKRFAGLIVLAGALVLGWHYTPEDLKYRFLSTFYKGVAPAAVAADTSAEGRLEGLKQGIEIFSENPILGIGPGNFSYSWDSGMSAHNLYGQLLGELGVIGFFAFALMVWTIYSTHRGNRLRIDELQASRAGPPKEADGLRLMRLLSVASVQVLILLLFNGNFGHNLYRYNWLWVGVIAIVSAHALRRWQTERTESRIGVDQDAVPQAQS
jgi:O-antigen ligase